MRNDFSKQFKPILDLGLAESQRFGSPIILSEHFVLAAIRQPGSYVVEILKKLGKAPEAMIHEIENYLNTHTPTTEATTLFEQEYKIAVSAIRHLQLATSEARKMNARTIRGEHIILALMHDNRSMDSEFLKDFKEKNLNFEISVQNISDEPHAGPEFSDDEEEDDAPRGVRQVSRRQSRRD